MKKIIYSIAILSLSYNVNAQVPEDALRMSWNTPSGTARQQAIGGAMGSLGGEISSIYVNPAGLGLYKTGEIVLSPGLSLLRSKGQFRGTDAKAEGLNKFNFGTSGLVFGHANSYSKWTSMAFGIAVNRTANFNGSSIYRGANDYSSFTEPMANEFFDYYSERKRNDPSLTNQRIVDDALDEANISLQTKMGLYTYLVDVDTTNGQAEVISRAERIGTVNQQNKFETTGGITELAFGFAGNMDDKLYLGASLGVPIVDYSRNSVFTESDPSTTANNFGFSSYEEDYSVKGLGLNAKLGIIFKPADYVRLGFGIHTPTLYGLKDNFSSKMVTDVEQLFGSGKGLDSVSSEIFYDGQNPEFTYDLVSPWKFMLSGSYVLHEVNDVTKQKGFITADIEYVTHKSSKYSSSEENGDDSYYKDVNTAIKNVYKNAFNFRVGGELKFKTIMTRLGFALLGKPYEASALKARRMNISGGLGYRNKGIFVDLAYVHSINKDVNFPYRLDAPRENTFAELKDTNGNILVTVGFKF